MNDILFNIRFTPPFPFFPFPLSIRCHAGGKIVKLVSVLIVNKTVQNIHYSSESILKVSMVMKEIKMLFIISVDHDLCVDPPTGRDMRQTHLIYTVADQTFSIFYHTVSDISATLFFFRNDYFKIKYIELLKSSKTTESEYFSYLLEWSHGESV